MQTDIIKIDSTPALVSVNFNEIREALDAELAKYKQVVTSDNVKDAKKQATEINKLKKKIADKRKEVFDLVTAPAEEFKGNMKSLEDRAEEVRQGLLEQAKKYEDETRAKAAQLLETEAAHLWGKHQVKEEFRKADHKDLVTLSAVTGTGKLASAARTKLEQRILADKQLQDRTEMRLVKLENESYRAGLSAPLTRDHVAGFLFADDDTYNAELDRLMTAEKQRQEQTERHYREQREKEQRQQAEREQAERDREERAQASQTAQEAQPEPAAEQPKEAASEATAQREAGPGAVQVTATAQFSTTVPAGTSDADIEAALRDRMEKAGITTLQSITITRAE